MTTVKNINKSRVALSRICIFFSSRSREMAREELIRPLNVVIVVGFFFLFFFSFFATSIFLLKIVTRL